MCLVTILLFGGGAVALYFVLRPAPVNHPRIVLGQQYFIKDMRNGLFRFPNDHGMPSASLDDIITFQNQDRSFAVFEDNWKTFRIRFDHTPTRYTEFRFIVSEIRHTGRQGFRATITHIYDGSLRTYTVTTEPTRIVIRATAITRVLVASEEFAPSPVEEVFRSNTVIMRFAFDRPGYII